MGNGKSLDLYFTGPRQVEVREVSVPPPGIGQVVVKTVCSAISAGTEMLIYRGEAPTLMAADTQISALAGTLAYPLAYGYALVGQVVEIGAQVDPVWLGQSVFVYHPHAGLFVTGVASLLPVPEDVPLEEATFLANMETALTLLLDGAPLTGEQIAVFGQGIVGLLTTALLAWQPFSSLVVLDRYSRRREAALALGAQAAFDPTLPEVEAAVRVALQGAGSAADADLTYELSGMPAALDQALAVTGFAGRVVLGSWYGGRRAAVDLGGAFHRSRIRLLTSQVSTLAPELTGRWSRARRWEVAWTLLARLRPAFLISHRFPITQAAEAYRLLDEAPGETLQLLFSY